MNVMVHYDAGMTLEPLGPAVFQVPFLDEAETDAILRQARRAPRWQAAPTRKRAQGTTSLREDVRLAHEMKESEAPAVFAGFAQLVRARAASLAALLSINDFEVSELRLVRYDEGGYFKVHTDTSGDDRRRIAVVIYLNDDFDGGATIFPLLGCRSVPRKGRGVVFPAEKLHRGDVVTGGSKYILVLWLLDPASPE
jgi:predicted 2-oxoglutarate/Fe(II)-dependent dioxygenase YbiX